MCTPAISRIRICNQILSWLEGKSPSKPSLLSFQVALTPFYGLRMPRSSSEKQKINIKFPGKQMMILLGY